jgi:hypothetical protein
MEKFKKFFLISINVIILIKNYQCASAKNYGSFPIVIDQRNNKTYTYFNFNNQINNVLLSF